jgi:hypothetical protein
MSTQQSRGEEKRTEMVSVRYAGEEMERIRLAAERQGSSVAAFIRNASLVAKPRIPAMIQLGTNNVAANTQGGATLTLHQGKPVINT